MIRFLHRHWMIWWHRVDPARDETERAREMRFSQYERVAWYHSLHGETSEIRRHSAEFHRILFHRRINRTMSKWSRR